MMSRFVKDTSSCGGEGSAKGSSASEGPSQPSNHLDHEIAHLTKLGSEPHELLTRAAHGRSKLPISTVKMLVARETNHSGRGRFSSADGCHVLSRYLPITGPCRVDQMNSRAYTSQFSADGSLFVAGFQGSHIRIYNVNKGWKVQKDILAKSLRWTITDTSLSPDQQYLVYASMSPMVHIVNVGSAATESVANITEIHDGLDFSVDDNNDEFGIFSVKYSNDGRELVAASSSNSIYVYDLEAKRLSLQIPAHMSDVNTVCFADETGHLLYSGSDDNLCKVWDRRCFITKGQAAGVLMGHLQGITFLDSRGDGRYLISNGKDQTTKLWDIRKMSSTVIYTGQKYIYTGSSDSSVYIYDLVSGAQVARLDYHDAPVRDCNWHPVYPMIISSSWDGDIVKWEFPGSDESPPIKRRKRRRKNYL